MTVGHGKQWSVFLLLGGSFVWGLLANLEEVETYLFVTFNNSGKFFAYILLLLFLVALYCVLDRLFFWVTYDLFGAKLDFKNEEYERSERSPKNFFYCFRGIVEDAKRYGEGNVKEKQGAASPRKRIIVGDIFDNAYQETSNKCLDGQEILDKCLILDYIGVIAPIVGFIGTLAGLMDAFGELANGGETQQLLAGLGVSMSTSLVGAFISVICITVSQVSNQLNAKLEDNLKTIQTDFTPTQP